MASILGVKLDGNNAASSFALRMFRKVMEGKVIKLGRQASQSHGGKSHQTGKTSQSKTGVEEIGAATGTSF